MKPVTAAAELVSDAGGPEWAASRHYVHPGHIFFGSDGALISTILGSCVSVFLHHPQSSTGGLNHYLLPFGGGANSARFADVANEALLQRFRVLGIEARSLRAKVFGGARMGMIKSDLAAKNIEAAFEFCKRIGVPVVSSDVGGERGRKLLLRISDGAAWIRLL